MADGEETADEDSPNPHGADLKLEMTDQEERKVILSTSKIETMSELLEGEIKDNPIENVKPDPQDMGDNLMLHETDGKKRENDILKEHVSRPLRSTCKPRSRDPRRCQKHFREMIGKHEIKNEELEKKEVDLRQRLEMLECSMPAVMVWNTWRMSQGAPVPSIRRVVEKQFQGLASGALPCPSTPSQHYDCRIREVEAERKQAQRRADDARALWAEKELALEEQKKKLEEARKTQALHKQRIEKLTVEVQELRKAKDKERAKDEGSCETGECGELRCKQMWLGDVASTTSVKSTDLECLARLQELAEAELCMKRHIAELERREETYMRTLQQADELWSKMEGDTASTMSELQVQLDLKTSANQQLADKVCSLEDAIEKLNTRLANCRNELGKFVGIENVDAMIGGDDDHAEVADKETHAGSEMRDNDTMYKRVRMVDTDTMADADADGPCGDNEICGSFDDSEGEPCAPDFVCNDVVFSPTGMEDTKGVLMNKSIEREDGRIVVPSSELKSWLSVSINIQQTVSACSNCSPKKDEVEKLSESIRSYLQEGKDIPSLKQVIATPEIHEHEADLGRQSDEEYQMAVEDLSDDEIPSKERKESKKMQVLEAGAPTVIGKLSSEKIVQDGEAVERHDEKKMAGLNAIEEDQIENEEKTFSDVLHLPDKSVKDREEEIHEDIGEEIISEGKQVETVVKGEEETENFGDDKEVQDAKAREEIFDTIPKEEDEEKFSVASEKDKLPKKDSITGKEIFNIISKEEDEEKFSVASEKDKLPKKASITGKEIFDIIPKEEDEQKFSVASEKDKLSEKVSITGKEKEVAGEKLELEIEPIAEEEDGGIVPSEQAKEEITEDVEMLVEDQIKKEQQSIAEDLSTEELKEEVAITEDATVLPKEEVGEDIAEKELEEETVSVELERGVIPTIPEVETVDKKAPGDLEEKIVSEEDFYCACQPEQVPREETKVEKDLPKSVSKEKEEEIKLEKDMPKSISREKEEEKKVEKDLYKLGLKEEEEIRKDTICNCKDKTRSRPKLIIIRHTICRRPDEVKAQLQRDGTTCKVKATKLSYTKVKDESIGTVVSVGLQTERHHKKERSPLRKRFVDNNVGRTEEAQTLGSGCTMNSLSIVTDESAQQEKVLEEYKVSKDSESRCFMCKKELSSKDNIYVPNDVQAAFAQKMSGPKLEISMMCCSCQHKQNSKSRVQSKNKFQVVQKPKKCICSPSAAIVQDTKNVTTISQEKKDQNRLAKIVQRKIEYKERKQKCESEPNVKHKKRSLENHLKHESESKDFSQAHTLQTDTSQLLTESSSRCTCITGKTSSLNGKKSTNAEKVEENRSCHCGDSD